MNLYQQLGYLVLGSRLRRLSEAFLSEITRAYQLQGIDFDAGWFPVFYLLFKNESMSIKELSEQIEISHPAASQLVTGLKNKGLIQSKTSKDDGRKQLITLSKKGKDLLAQVLPVWDALLLAMEEMMQSQSIGEQLLPAITALETAFQSTRLADQIIAHLPQQENTQHDGKGI
jgi:DNA-binding MarR family transcriptional regulator